MAEGGTFDCVVINAALLTSIIFSKLSIRGDKKLVVVMIKVNVNKNKKLKRFEKR